MDKLEIKKLAMEEIVGRVKSEEDYIHHKKFDNSLKKFLVKFPDGIEDYAIARVLGMTTEEVKAIYEEAIVAIRKNMLEQADYENHEE